MPDLTPQKFALTLMLPPEVAKRLQMLAETQKRSAAEVAIDVLDRNLPRPSSKPKIPYT